MADPFMAKCCYPDCEAAPEWEHAFIYAGKQVNEPWAIIPVCVYHHRGEGLDKQYNQYVALRRATMDDLAKYPRANWSQLKRYLQTKYADHL